MEEVIPQDILKVIPGQFGFQCFSLGDNMQSMKFSAGGIDCRPSAPYARALVADLERHFKIGYQTHHITALCLYVEPVTQRLIDSTETELEIAVQGHGELDAYIPLPVTGIPFDGFPQGFALQIGFRCGRAVFTAISEAVFRHIHLMFPDKSEIGVLVTQSPDAPPQDVFIPMHPPGPSTRQSTARSLFIHRVLELAKSGKKEVAVSGRGDRLNIQKHGGMVFRGSRTSALDLFRLLRKQGPRGLYLFKGTSGIQLSPSKKPLLKNALGALSLVREELLTRTVCARACEVEALTELASMGATTQAELAERVLDLEKECSITIPERQAYERAKSVEEFRLQRKSAVEWLQQARGQLSSLNMNLRELSAIAGMDEDLGLVANFTEALAVLAHVDTCLVPWLKVDQAELTLVDVFLAGLQERVHELADTLASQAEVEERTQVRLGLAGARSHMAALQDALDTWGQESRKGDALHGHERALREQQATEHAHAAAALRDARALLGDFIRREEDVARCREALYTLEDLRVFARRPARVLPPDFPDTPLVQSVRQAMAAYEYAGIHSVADFARSNAVRADEDAAMLENALAALPEPVQVTFVNWKPLRPVDIEHLFPCNILCRIFPNCSYVDADQTEFILRTSAEFQLWRARGPALHAFEHGFVEPAPAPHEDHEVAPRQKRLKAPVPDDSEAQLLALLHGLHLRFRDVVDFLGE